MFSRAYLRVVLFLLVLLPSGAGAGLLSGDTDAELPYHLTADRLHFDDVTRTYEARGRVIIKRGTQALYADAVDFHVDTKQAEAWVADPDGAVYPPRQTRDAALAEKTPAVWWNLEPDRQVMAFAPKFWEKVYFISGRDRLKGNRIEMNLDTGTGTVYDGHLFIEENHFYVRGDEIKKTGKDTYYVKDDVGLTTCDGPSPDWEITGRDLRVTIEGYGTLKHVAFRAKSIPVLYAPYILFPAKIKRQTGLLVPLMLYSDTNGFEYIQPFFWAINESSDATVYEHYMAHRGYKHGLQYRYVLSPDSRGTVMYDYLYDKQIDDGTERTGSSGYYYEGFREDDVDRLNRKRWWLRAKNDWRFPGEILAKLDLDIVSDQDYLREFDTLYSGYDHSDDYFLQEFGRGLDDETETVRLNQLYVNRNWNQYSLNADFRWFDDIIAREHDKDDTALQELPSITFLASKQQAFDSPFYFDGTAALNHFWRDVGPRGYSAELYPRFYFPTTILNYVDLEPSVGVRETAWQIESGDEDPLHDTDILQSRELYDLKVDLSTEISRVFDVDGGSTDKIRHAITPQVVYSYVKDVEQEDVPDFVGIVEEESKITYSLTNTFTARRGKTEKPNGESPPRYSYREFCRLKLSQSYDIVEATETLPPDVERRPFSDVEGRLELSPWNWFNLVNNITWSPYDRDVTSHDGILSLKDNRGDRLSLDYQYEPHETETALVTVFLELFEPFSVSWEEEYNLREQEDAVSTLTFFIEPQCWALRVSYTDDRISNKREYAFEISLYGLGEYELGQYDARRTEHRGAVNGTND